MGKSSRKKNKGTEEIGVSEGGPPSLRERDAAGIPQKTFALKPQNLTYYLAASVSAITFLVYLTSLQNGFIRWDDPDYVSKNIHIRSFDPALVKWAFFEFYASNWHPLTWMSHAVDYALWGLNPVGHHLTSIILHAINTFLVVVLVARLVEAAKPLAVHDSPFTFHSSPFTFHSSPFTLIAAATTGLLFGIHPLHVESVAWVAERKDLLCGLFFLLSIMAYLNAVKLMEQGAERKSLTLGTMRYALCFFVLALLSKPMAVSLPVVLLILDWFPLGRMQSVRSLRSALFEKLPFIGLSLISSVLTVLAQKSGDAMAMMKFLPLSTRLNVAAKALIVYLGNMAFPLDLLPYYPYPEDASSYAFEYLLSILSVLGITLLCMGILRKNKLWASVWIYYVVTLVPVLGIIQVGGQAMADRYTYLPSLGPFLVIGVLAAWVSMKADSVNKRNLTLRLFAPAAAIVFLLLPLTYLTVQQIGVWKNDFTLWDHVIENHRIGTPFVYYNRGLAFMAMGRTDRAIDDFNKAIALDPSDYHAYIDRGFVYSETGKMDKALEDFGKAIALNPRSCEAYTNKGMVYGKAGLFDKAIEQFSKAIDIKPDSAIAYGNRGLAYSLIGRHDRALEDLNKALQLDENYAEAYGDRGNLYLKTGNRELAVSDFQKACDLGDKEGCDVLKAFGR